MDGDLPTVQTTTNKINGQEEHLQEIRLDWSFGQHLWYSIVPCDFEGKLKSQHSAAIF
jgi:hypothetical protein